MTDRKPPDHYDLATRITRLVEQRGWNQEDFARAAGLNRETVRQILNPTPGRRLRNVTISRCTKALGVTVHELREASLPDLLARAEDAPARYEGATQPELAAWAERNPERAKTLSTLEMDELLSLQGTGGPLTRIGVEHFIEVVERKRKLVEQVHTIAGTEYLPFLEQFVRLLYEKIQPYRDRK